MLAIGFLISALLIKNVAAGSSPLEGVFGNAEGCRAYDTGQPVTNYLLLTGDTFSSTAVGCAFQSLDYATTRGFTGNAVCSPGGNQTVRIIDHGAAGYGVVVGDGAEFGPLASCRPDRITGSLPRVQL